MGELPSGGGTNSNSQDDNLSLEQALLAALLATGTASVVGAKVAEAKEKRRQAVKADNQSNDKANQQKIAQAEKVKQDDQAYAKRMVEQLQQHGQFWLSAALVSVLGIGVCAYLLSNPQYDHLPIAYDCEMGLVQHVVPYTSTTIVQYPSAGTKNPFIGANPFVMIAVLGFVGKLLEAVGKATGTVSKIISTISSPLVGAGVGITVGLVALVTGYAILNNVQNQAEQVRETNQSQGFTTTQTIDEFMEQFVGANPCLLVEAIPTDDPNIFEFTAHPFNVPEGYRIEWSTTGEILDCQGSSCRIRFNNGEHHVTAKLTIDNNTLIARQKHCK
jgi:hypothetical protein